MRRSRRKHASGKGVYDCDCLLGQSQVRVINTGMLRARRLEGERKRGTEDLLNCSYVRDSGRVVDEGGRMQRRMMAKG